MVRKSLLMVVIALALGLGLLQISGCAGRTDAADPSANSQSLSALRNTITVSGEGKVYAPSDEASLSFVVRTVRSTASRAMNDNSEATNKVVNALKNKGLTDKEVSTGNVALFPQQDWREGRAPKIISYTAENRIIVRTKQLVKLGELIDASTTAGATEVSELRFQLSEDSESKQDALKTAVRNARKKAEVLAKEMGRGIGEAIILSEGAQPAPIIPYDGMALKSAAGYARDEALSVPIMPQDVLVTGEVSVSFELN